MLALFELFPKFQLQDEADSFGEVTVHGPDSDGSWLVSTGDVETAEYLAGSLYFYSVALVPELRCETSGGGAVMDLRKLTTSFEQRCSRVRACQMSVNSAYFTECEGERSTVTSCGDCRGCDAVLACVNAVTKPPRNPHLPGAPMLPPCPCCKKAPLPDL